MKKNNHILILAALCVATLFLVTSCSNSSEKLRGGKITRIYNKELKESALSQEFATIKAGYYETTEEERCELKKLEAAGLVSVTFERFAWWEKTIVEHSVRKVYYDWWGYPNYQTVKVKEPEYTFCDHIMANVTLTDKAKKQIVTDLPEPSNKEDKDVKQPKFDASKYPDCNIDCTEDWPFIRNPFIKEEKTESVETKKSEKAQSSQSKEETKEETKVERKDSTQYVAYVNALQKVNETVYSLKGCDNKVIKSKNIQIRNVNGFPIATAIVIIEKKNVSDAYRIQTGVIPGQKIMQPVCLTYYQDKGWTLLNDLSPYLMELEKAGVDLVKQVKQAMEGLHTEESDSSHQDEQNVEE